ncbi:hypothetical protein [Granulosicoccus antarcticus]|uniref:ATP synthase subunit b n=1 Tax=Granulosicoccus antarcticus IMCC3135 TaxID=1192854 RepID=A0A2Z2NT81_9GAMM|nr:hypothetical protein [Granulosicoccus antarcticus]ASJ74762.1 ATP synthase subunit b, sodium ion specific [Granulosicoccus antarcticus IMCC3135]
MTIDFWGLGLQVVNVLILIWLLSRVFWRPISTAIAKRQEATHAMLATAQTTQSKADETLSRLLEDRNGIEMERTTLLANAATEAQEASKAILADAQKRADTLLSAAQTSVERNNETARKDNAVQASALSVDIAAKLLGRLNSPTLHNAFLASLLEAIATMSDSERASLLAADDDIQIVSAAAPTSELRDEIEKAVITALGGAPSGLSFVVDPDLINGLELRSKHFVLHNSWQADLAVVLKEMKGAA